MHERNPRLINRERSQPKITTLLENRKIIIVSACFPFAVIRRKSNLTRIFHESSHVAQAGRFHRCPFVWPANSTYDASLIAKPVNFLVAHDSCPFPSLATTISRRPRMYVV